MVIDVIVILALVVFTLSGYRKGAILSLCTLLVLVLSCLGATVAQHFLAPDVARWLEPRTEAIVEEKVSDWIRGNVDEKIEDAEDLGISVAGKELTLGDIKDLLGSFGIHVEEKIRDTTERVTEPAAEAVARELTEAIVETLARLLVWVAAFVILYLIFDGIILILNVADRVPVLHGLNHLGGGLIGFISCAFLSLALVTLLERLGFLGETALGSPTVGLLRSLVERLF